MNLILSYQKYQQPVYNGQSPFLVTQQGAPPLIVPTVPYGAPQQRQQPPPPQITEQVLSIMVLFFQDFQNFFRI